MSKVYAVKRSQRYEGARHRLRLLEEFDILRHLATTTTPKRSRSMSLSSSRLAGPFPPVEAPDVNVLHFVRGWEQDSMLFIQTEICELGNLSEFLIEFGAKFNRLDEPRIWKIMSEVGNVSLRVPLLA
jgi:mitosis inhibitor protein kinase SWE1